MRISEYKDATVKLREFTKWSQEERYKMGHLVLGEVYTDKWENAKGTLVEVKD